MPRVAAIPVALALLVGLLGIAPGAQAAKPPLVYVVVLDGLDGDRIEAGAAPFISSLLAGERARATYFPQSRSVIPSETNPNHVAMMSGAYPGRSGIASNTFAIYAPLLHEDSCAPTGPHVWELPPTETSGESATCPQAEMVFAAIKRQAGNRGPATAAVFGKPKLGRIFAGRNVRRGRTDADYLWAPCSSGSEDDAYCEDVPTNPLTGYALDDRTVMDRVLRTIDGPVRFPSGATRPDFSFVNLHQIDTVGHITGPGILYDAAIRLADNEVARLVATLRARGEWERTVLILVSDHSMDRVGPKVSLTDAFTAAGVSDAEFVAMNNESSIDFVYLANRRSRERFALLARMREIALARPGVAEALYREPNPLDGGRAHTLTRVHPEWRNGGRRAPDLFVTAKPGVGFGEPFALSNPLLGNHGATQTADNFLAVIGGGPLVRHGTVRGKGRSRNPVNVDIAPTVTGLFGLAAPADSQGRFLARAFDRAELRRVARPDRPRLHLRRGRELVITPVGGVFDVEVRAGKRWKRVRSASDRRRLSLRRLPGDERRVRARARSAAGIAGPWRAVSVTRR